MATLQEEVALPSDDLYRETANRFEITRLGRKVKSAIGKDVELAKAREGVKIDGDMLRWEL